MSADKGSRKGKNVKKGTKGFVETAKVAPVAPTPAKVLRKTLTQTELDELIKLNDDAGFAALFNGKTLEESTEILVNMRKKAFSNLNESLAKIEYESEKAHKISDAAFKEREYIEKELAKEKEVIKANFPGAINILRRFILEGVAVRRASQKIVLSFDKETVALDDATRAIRDIGKKS